MHTLCFLWEEAGFHHLTESHYLIHTAASGLLLMYWPLNWRNIMLFTSIQTMMLLLFTALMGADGRLWPVRTMRHKTVKWMVKWDPETEQRTRVFFLVSENCNLKVCFVLRPNVWWHLVTRSNHRVWRGRGRRGILIWYTPYWGQSNWSASFISRSVNMCVALWQNTTAPATWTCGEVWWG